MRLATRVGLAWCAVLVYVVSATVPATAAEGKPKKKPKAAAVAPVATQSVAAALTKVVNLSFQETPLGDVLDFLHTTTGLQIVVNRRALDEEGISVDTPITFAVSEISARSALRLMLTDLGLTYRVTDGMLIITTMDDAECRLTSRVYPVGDLLRVGTRELPIATTSDDQYGEIAEMVMSTIAIDSWDEVGGPGAICPLPRAKAMVVSQTDDVLARLDAFFATLRRVHKLSPQPAAGVAALTQLEARAETRIREKLASLKLPIDVHDTPLSEFVQFVQTVAEIPVVIDRRALDDAGLTSDTPVTARLQGIRLGAALTVILDELDLTWSIENEVLTVTTKDEAENQLDVRVYAVADLIGGEDKTRAPDYDSLIYAVNSAIAPDSWMDVGGPGEIQPFPQFGQLVIAQTEHVHARIDRLFADLRAARQTGPQTQSAGVTSTSVNRSTVNKKSTPNSASNDQTIRIYSVQVDGKELAEVAAIIRSFVQQTPWGDRPDNATIQAVGSRLVIRHTARGHRMIHELLDAIYGPPPINSTWTPYNAGMFGGFGGGFGGGGLGGGTQNPANGGMF